MAGRMQTQILSQLPSLLVKKGEFLVKSGQRSDVAFYVVKGCLRSYLVDQKGKEHIYQFAPEEWIISDLEFSKNKGNAMLNIDAIEDSEIKVMAISSFEQLQNGQKELVEEALRKLQNRIYALQKRVIHLLSFTAEERYREFVAMYPGLSNRVPLKMIASYLGVTPESLSRVRKEMVKNN